MTRKRHGGPEAVGRGRYAVLIALLVFAALAATPVILDALHLRIDLGAPTTSHGVRLLPAPSAPPRVVLPSVASPIDPGQRPASLPAVKAASQAAAVAAEDSRIELLVHDAASIYQPEVVPVRGSLPTLVLTAGSQAYTYADLVRYGALALLPDHAGLLLDNVLVSTNARLYLGAPALRTLYLDSSSSGFTSIVAWGGSLTFRGTAQQPLTIMGWDRATSSPAKDAGSGRPYIREVGGRMDLTNARVSSLGFWSGRTGGVAWTGSTGQPSTGGATSSTFTDDTYGAFVTRGRNVTFDGDLFEFNELDGLHIHRYMVGTSVSDSSAVRNGGNGFLVDRVTSGTVFKDVVSEHNTGDGILVDGQPLVTGASAEGGSVTPDSGTSISSSAVLGNGKTGILLEGGTGTVLRSNEVCASLTGIAIRDGARNTVVTGNDVRCGPRAAVEIGPAAPGTVISGNALVNARIGMLISSSGAIQTYKNLITGAKVFGITARGATSQVTGQSNVISGTGFRAVDARADASSPALSGTQDAGWAHHAKTTFWSYLRFHPLAMLWLSILILVIGGEIWSRTRRMPPHPYPASTHWRPLPAIRPPRVPAEAHARAALAGAGDGGGFLPERALAASPGGVRVVDRARPGDGHPPPDAASSADERPPGDVMTPGHGHQRPDGATLAGGHGPAARAPRVARHGPADGYRADHATLDDRGPGDRSGVKTDPWSGNAAQLDANDTTSPLPRVEDWL